MSNLLFRVLRYLALTIVTSLAGLVMWWTTSGDPVELTPQSTGLVAAPPPIARPRPRVAIQEAVAQDIELTELYSGKMRPWETYSLSFGVGGRVLELGTHKSGRPLDDGDEVEEGQILARLDDRIYRARKSEAAAQLEEAATEMQRAQSVRRSGNGIITDAEYQEKLTRLALARAQQEVALKNLDDATLVAPVRGTISRRLVNVGESIDMNRVAFEIVQDEEILLVVDVPESQVARIDQRMKSAAGSGCKAYIHLESGAQLGQQPRNFEAEVFRIAEVADTRTGLFEVEVRIPNPEGKLRAGMVAKAEIVVDTIHGYRIPEPAVIFRGRDVSLFALESAETTRSVMFWDLGKSEIYRAKRVGLGNWYEQGEAIIIPSDSHRLARVVVRGQERLSDGQLVRVAKIMAGESAASIITDAETREGAAAEGSGESDYES